MRQRMQQLRATLALMAGRLATRQPLMHPGLWRRWRHKQATTLRSSSGRSTWITTQH
jgi:hypothetical protein